MKSTLLATLALPVILLTGCASGGYYGYDDGYYGPGYYDPGYVYGGPVVDVGFYDGGHGYYNHGYSGYHHYDSGYRHTAVASSSFRSGGSRVASSASVSHGSFRSSGGRSASVSASAGHASGGGHDSGRR